MDLGDKKGKEKVEDKRKEPIFFMDVSIVDLDDLDVSNNRMHCDNSSSNDDDAISLEGMDVGDGGASNSQCPESESRPAVEPLQYSVPVHSDRPSESTFSGIDVLHNATGKTLHPNKRLVGSNNARRNARGRLRRSWHNSWRTSKS